jgi:DNA-directed RNA polymerase subunit RPC12/RpoP
MPPRSLEKRRENHRKSWHRHRDVGIKRMRMNHQKTTAAKHGVTVEFLRSLREQQNYLCAICGRQFDQSLISHRAVLDHDHTTDRIRGYLCNGCNIAIGCFQESLEVIEKAAEYLRKHMEAQT